MKRIMVAGWVGAAALWAQEAPISTSSIQINFPKDSPVALLQMQTGESRATARGLALLLDLHMSLSLRNISPNRIHGVTLRVVSQEVTLGGKASASTFRPSARAVFGLTPGPTPPNREPWIAS